MNDSHVENLQRALQLTCQACLGRNEPHTCAPSHMADERGPMTMGSFLVWAQPEREITDRSILRSFIVATTNNPDHKIVLHLEMDKELKDGLKEIDNGQQ